MWSGRWGGWCFVERGERHAADERIKEEREAAWRGRDGAEEGGDCSVDRLSRAFSSMIIWFEGARRVYVVQDISALRLSLRSW